MSKHKRLVVNADDFGFTPDVNQGIVEAHLGGILSATTLMATGAAFDDAVRLARETPSLDIGCHLVLIGGRSPATGKPLPGSVTELIGALAARALDPYAEMRAQVRRLLDCGLRPSHLDTHKHTHFAPPVLDALARIAEEFEIRWVRRPFDLPMTAMSGIVPALTRLTSGAMGMLRRRFHRVLERHGCRTTDYFAGFQLTGRMGRSELVNLLGLLPEGSTELMVHPGRCGDALRHAHTRLKESRERELEALVSREAREALERHGIELVNYGGLA